MSINKPRQAIGYLGGTFDPIHIGHLQPALEIAETLALETLFLMPNHIAPHKSQTHCDAAQRTEMVALAIADHPKMQLDTRELKRNKPSYTIDTLKELKEDYPDTPICFIMGMDSLLNFDKWHKWQEVLNYCHLIVSQRPQWKGHFNNTVQTLVDNHKTINRDDLHQLQQGKIYFQETNQFDISSTEIRRLLKQGRSIKHLVPTAVSAYIQAHHLYQYC